MKEAETTLHMIWEIEGIIAKLLMLKFAYHSTSYLFCALWLCAHSPANQGPHTPNIYIYVFFQKKILNFYLGLLVNLNTTDELLKRTNGSIVIDPVTYICVVTL